jgi:ADP-ribosylglycohydrolase
MDLTKVQSVIVGAAIGDALGVPRGVSVTGRTRSISCTGYARVRHP